MQAYSLCSFHPMHLLHKHLRTCIIQDRKPRARSSPEEPKEQLEVQPQEVTEADEEDIEELLECPDHRPSSFERGKPRSIFLSVCNY